MDLDLPYHYLWKPIVRYLNFSTFNIKASEAMDITRRSVCQFQLDFSNYNFECAQAHKRFKDATTPEEKYRTHEELLNTSAKLLNEYMGRMEPLIREVYETSRPTHKKHKARIGIHLIVNDDKKQVARFIPKPSNNAPPKNVDDYSIFKNVDESGVPALCNNTAREMIHCSNYRYGNLDVSKIKREYLKSPGKWLEAHFKDLNWVSRWNRNVRDHVWDDKKWNELALLGGTGKAFKSHLVTPITFGGHIDSYQLSEELVRMVNLRSDKRSILGYIMVDHPGAHYFRKSPRTDEYGNFDVDVLYVFADMISLYLLTHRTYVEGSDTVKNYQDELNAAQEAVNG